MIFKLNVMSGVFLVTLASIFAGGVAAAMGHSDTATLIWGVGAGTVLLRLCWLIVKGLQSGEFGLDVIAALAMAGALILGETLAGVIVGLMFSGGQLLEQYAQDRAASSIRGLVSRVPQTAQRLSDGGVSTIAVSAIVAGDHLLVRPGDVIAVDGIVEDTKALMDESVMTGESMPVVKNIGDTVISGSVNAGAGFVMEATQTAQNSVYAAIVRLVEVAQASKAPFQRLAERYSLGFLALTLGVAGLGWLISGDPRRALAVLVVATPCPLILAVPVALVAGLSRCARHGVLVKTAAVLETMARISVVLIDKTGTLTAGRPEVQSLDVVAPWGEEDVLRLGGALAQGSHHVVSAALAEAARARGLDLTQPTSFTEEPGEGVFGTVEGHNVRIGGRAFVGRGVADTEALPPNHHDSMGLWIAINGAAAGSVQFSDPIRPESAAALRAFKRDGVSRIVLVTGDRLAVARAVAAGLPIDEIVAEVTPSGKVESVRVAHVHGLTAMIGDGINDAPALAAADVGIALGARGAGASSEAADAVLLVDRLDHIPVAFAVARRTMRIARQSVLIGIGLSLLGMGAAAFGYLPPLAGAIAQEGIDVAVILNALRALGGDSDVYDPKRDGTLSAPLDRAGGVA